MATDLEMSCYVWRLDTLSNTCGSGVRVAMSKQVFWSAWPRTHNLVDLNPQGRSSALGEGRPARHE